MFPALCTLRTDLARRISAVLDDGRAESGVNALRESGYRTPTLPHLNCRIPRRVHSDDGDERFFVLARESPSRDFLAAVGV